MSINVCEGMVDGDVLHIRPVYIKVSYGVEDLSFHCVASFVNSLPSSY